MHYKTKQCLSHTHKMFEKIICLILPTINYRVKDKYNLIRVECHDGIVTNSKIFFDSFKTKKIYLVISHYILVLTMIY